MKKTISVPALLMWSLLLGCPDVPLTPIDAIPSDIIEDGGDVFIPLELDRILESVGEPEGGERVSLYGSGFTKGATVLFGKNEATGVLVMDESQINCDVPASEPGLVDVRVILKDGQEAELQRGYLYRGPLELSSVSPGETSSREETLIRVKGAFFDETTRILVGGRLLRNSTLIDDETIEGVVPARLQGHSGLVDVIASNGFEQRSLRNAFRFLDDLHVAWVAPPSGKAKGGSTVTLYGGGLSGDTVVTIGGKQAETLIKGNGNTLTVRVPPLAPGQWDIEVTNGGETRILENAFIGYEHADQPGPIELLGAWPSTGRSAGGTAVALTVVGLPWSGAAQGLTVEVNGSVAEVIEVNALESLVVIDMPPGPQGGAIITISRDGQSATRDDVFSYEAGLEIAKIIPSSGPLKSDDLVVIEGQGFEGGIEVLVGNQIAEVQSINPEGTRMNIHMPESVPGMEDVQLRVKGKHTIANAGYHFLHSGTKRILALSPPDGAQAGGRILRVHGEGLSSFGSTLHIGKNPIPDVSVIDDSTLLVRSPAGEIGSMNVDAGTFGLMAMVYQLFDPGSRYGGTQGGTIPEALNVTVLDMAERQPVPDAFVILWDDLGTPYQGLTDKRGQITFSDTGFGPPQMVTAGKDMHTTASVVDFDARNVTLFLYSFEPSPPGDGDPPPVEPVPNSAIRGEVTGLDKYIVLPPGQCDGIAADLSGTLCKTCVDDSDCEGEDSRCLDLGDQGKRCSIACTTDADCPAEFVCTGMGFGAIQCVPRPGEKKAFCASTQRSVFSYEAPGSFPAEPEEEEEPPNPDAEPADPITGPEGVFTDSDSLYELKTRPGEQAIVCFGGYLETNENTGKSTFVPLRMGVRRHVFAEPGQPISAQDVRLDIPLDRTMRVRLDGAPTEPGEADRHGIDMYLDFGADGVFRMPQRGFAVGSNEFSFEHFPTKFEDSLYDVTYRAYARAFTKETEEGLANDASHVLMRDIDTLNRDTVFEIVGQNALQTQYGINTDVHGIHGVGQRLWAAADRGQILVFDGTWWGLQQTPTKDALRSVWARTEEDIIAVGDNGTILRSQGIVWSQEVTPQDLSDVQWWHVHGVGSKWWLSGDAGLFAYDGTTFTKLLSDEDGRPQHIRGIWSGGAESAWIVGEGGLVRRWTSTGFESFDRPGGDLLAVSGLNNSDMWVVGEKGRILHWDGADFFEYLPITRDTLRGVHVVDTNNVWAVGDSGTVLHWNGQTWSLHASVEHIDFQAVGVTNQGKVLVGGLPVLIVGPFLPIPEPVNPTGLGQFMGSPISWKVGEGATPTMTLVGLAEVSGFPFWWLFVDGARRHVPLPDLNAAWGLMPIWPGDGFLRLTSFYIPDGSINEFDYGIVSQNSWRSWAIVDFPVTWW